MKKKFEIFCIIVAIIFIVGMAYVSSLRPKEIVSDYKNISYQIGNYNVLLANGENIDDGAVTRYFGNEVRADFNNDRKEDVAFILTENGGGTGTFYYVVAALSSKNEYSGTNGILLGDRISPKTTEFRDGEIIVNYADRKPNEPMSATPSIGVSRYFKIEGDKLIEIKK